MIFVSAIADWWMGLCRKTPVIHTAPGILIVPPEPVYAGQPDGNGPSAPQGRIRQGISIGAESLKTMVREREMLWYSLISGLIMTVLFALVYWTRGNIYYDPFLIRVPAGNFILWFDPRLIVIMAFCLFCFTFMMAGIFLYRNANGTDHPLTIREGLAGARIHAGRLAALSVALGIAGTILIAVITSDNLANISLQLVDTLLPYSWYLPDSLGLSITIWLFGSVLFVNLILFLALLYVVPAIVLENKGLVSALAESAILIRKTWREMLGCILVYWALFLFAWVISLGVSQSLPFYNYDPGFWYYQGLTPITTLGSVIILFCFAILIAVCSIAAVVAIADLYRSVGKSGGVCGKLDKNKKKPEPAL